jgi:hypothetical protein
LLRPEIPEHNGVARGDEPVSDCLVRIVVRDLADGETVPGIQLVPRTPDGLATEFSTSADGAVVIPYSKLEGLIAESEDWRIPRQTDEEIRRSGELWCYRMMRVEGRVEESSGPTRLQSPACLEAKYSPGIPFKFPHRSAAKPPWTTSWFRKHKVRETVSLGSSDIDGFFEFDVPRIRDLYVVAHTGDRRRTGVTPVELDSRTDSASIRIVLHSRSRVVGRIVGHDGRPVRVQSLSLYSQRRVVFSELDFGALKAIRGSNAFCVSADPATDEARLWFTGIADPDANGKFELFVNDSGEGLLVAWVAGHKPVRLQLGQLTNERALEEIRLSAPERREQIQFRYRGVPLSNHRIVAVDISEEIAQLGLPISRLDTQGEADGAWFELGRKYFFDLYGESLPEKGISGCLVFSGASTVEVSSDLTKLR